LGAYPSAEGYPPRRRPPALVPEGPPPGKGKRFSVPAAASPGGRYGDLRALTVHEFDRPRRRGLEKTGSSRRPSSTSDLIPPTRPLPPARAFRPISDPAQTPRSVKKNKEKKKSPSSSNRGTGQSPTPARSRPGRAPSPPQPGRPPAPSMMDGLEGTQRRGPARPLEHPLRSRGGGGFPPSP